MKAKSLVIILCIGMMCLTGLGQTTSDLTENSTADIVQVDDAVSVVLSLETLDQANVIPQDISQVNSFTALFTEAAFDIIYQDKLKELRQKSLNLLPDNSKRDRDVGWQNYSTAYEKTIHSINTSLHFSARNARDGIRHKDFFFSS